MHSFHPKQNIEFENHRKPSRTSSFPEMNVGVGNEFEWFCNAHISFFFFSFLFDTNTNADREMLGYQPVSFAI